MSPFDTPFGTFQGFPQKGPFTFPPKTPEASAFGTLRSEPTLIWCDTLETRIELTRDEIVDLEQKKAEIQKIFDSIKNPNVALIVADQMHATVVKNTFKTYETRASKRKRTD